MNNYGLEGWLRIIYVEFRIYVFDIVGIFYGVNMLRW